MENNEFPVNLIMSINWQERLKREMPFIEEKISQTSGKRVCDIGGGAGYHTLYLQEKGLEAVLIDRDEAVLHIAQENGVNNTLCASFLDFQQKVSGKFDFVFSLGNGLAALTQEEFKNFLGNVYHFLNPGGIFFSQILNFDYIRKQEYFVIASRSEQDFYQLRIARPHSEKQLNFQFVTIEYKTGIVSDKRLFFSILSRDFIQECAVQAGFQRSEFYADYSGNPHDRENGRDTIFILYKS